MARPQADYAATFDKIVKGMGTKPIELSGPEIASLIDEPSGRVVRMLDVMKRAGTLKFEFIDGRKPRYTLLDTDFASTEAKMHEKGIEWSAWRELNVSPQERQAKPQNGTVVRSLSDLAPLRKSEPRAELEVARKYRDQQNFINAERAKFQEMGLELPEPKLMYDEMRVVELEAIKRVLPYVESLETSNENLSTQNRTIRQPLSELNEARATIDRQKQQIERMVAEASRGADAMRAKMDDLRQEMLDYKRERDEAVNELKRLKGERSLNGALTAHEIHSAVDRVRS